MGNVAISLSTPSAVTPECLSVCPNCKRTVPSGDLRLYDADDMLCVHCSLIHACPPDGGDGLMSCCGQTPSGVPRTDRMTLDPALVTCAGS